MRGDVTHVETYIKFTLIYDFIHSCGIYLRKWLSQTSIEAMHEACFNHPDGCHQEELLPLPEVYTDPIGEFWSGSMDEQIMRSSIMQARAQGPPDWESGPEGINLHMRGCDDNGTHQTSHSGGVFERRHVRMASMAAQPASEVIEHGARPTRSQRDNQATIIRPRGAEARE